MIYGLTCEGGVDILLSQHPLTIRNIMNADDHFDVVESIVGATRDDQMKFLQEWAPVVAMIERDLKKNITLWVQLK